MTATQVLAALRARGVRITKGSDGKLGLRGPARGVMELRDEVRAHKPELLALLCASNQTSAIARGFQLKHSLCLTREPATQDSESTIAAKMLIRTCREYAVGLYLEPDGTLLVKSNGTAWRALVRAIEIHIEEVARLVEQKWDPCDT